MAKRAPNVIKSLLEAAQGAFFAAIEIHNKPKIEYRYQTSTLLMMNAWELSLKAYIYKFIGKRDIYEGEDGHTITLKNALQKVANHINGLTPKKFNAMEANIKLLEEYRNSFAHNSDRGVENVLFRLLSQAVINFSGFQKEHFKKDILNAENMILLPIGFKLPIEDINWLSKRDLSKSAKEFTELLKNAKAELEHDGIQDSIWVNISVKLESVRNSTRADAVVAVNNADETAVPVEQVRTVRLSNSVDAQEVRMTNRTLEEQFPYKYKQLLKKVKETNSEIRQTAQYTAIIAEIKNDPQLSAQYLGSPWRYSESAIQVVINKWNTLLLQTENVQSETARSDQLI